MSKWNYFKSEVGGRWWVSNDAWQTIRPDRLTVLKAVCDPLLFVARPFLPIVPPESSTHHISGTMDDCTV
jgi:hypothetical protein